MKISKAAMHAALFAGATIVFSSLGACKKASPPPPAPVSLDMPATLPDGEPPASGRAGKKADSNPVEAMKEFDAVLDAKRKLAEENRRTMVSPPASDFKPEAVDRKVRLKLILEKSKIRKGERPRFRLEMTNVGMKPLEYFEPSSSIFVKDGGLLNSSTIDFYLIDERNARMQLLPPPFGSKPRTQAGTRKTISKSEFKGINAEGQAHATFEVLLLPGETLHSIGDDPSDAEIFKTLRSEHEFDKPGVYRLEVTLDDRPKPLTKHFIEWSSRRGRSLEQLKRSHAEETLHALGPVSAQAALEVTR